MAIGYVYILLNPSMPGCLKIGQTERSSEERASELSTATGVPTKFHVAYDFLVSDCARVEELLHKRFSQHRISSDREFFSAPLKEVIAALNELAKDFAVSEVQNPQRASPQTTSAAAFRKSAANRPLPWNDLGIDGEFRLRSQLDEGAGRTRFLAERRLPTDESRPGYNHETVISKWVPIGSDVKTGIRSSEANRVPRGPGSVKYVDYDEGGHSCETTFDDGSVFIGGYRVDSAIYQCKAAINEGRWEQSLVLAESLVKTYPNAVEGYLYKTSSLQGLGRFGDAKSVLIWAFNRFPKEHRLHIAMAQCECRLGELEAAKRSVKWAKEIVGKDKVRQLTLGISGFEPLNSYLRGFVWW